MIDIITGNKGKGKTKFLLEKANKQAETLIGSAVFIDKSNKFIYGLDSRIRLINISDYPIHTTDQFLGFIMGIIALNTDIEAIFLDSFLTIGFIDTKEGLLHAVSYLERLSDLFEIRFIISISKNEDELPEEVRSHIVISL